MLLVKDMPLCDGTGDPPRRETVWVADGRFAAFGKEAISAAAHVSGHRVIQGSAELMMAPGFIDLHRHCDFRALQPGFGELELAQGITSALCGVCGMAVWPTPQDPDIAGQYAAYIRPCLGEKPQAGDFSTLRAYQAAVLRAGLPLNLGMLIGAGAVQVAVNGFAPGPLSNRARETAVSLIRDSLADGARGMSMGLMYTPECYLTQADRLALLRPLRDSGGTLFCHIRGEGDLLVDSVTEMLDTAERAGVPLQISHFKAVGKRNWGHSLHKVIGLIERARAAGQDVTVDFYPYDGGATTLLSLIPPPLAQDGTQVLLTQLDTAAGRSRLADALGESHAGWDNMLSLIGPERVILASSHAGHAAMLGKTLQEIAALLGGIAVPDALARLLVESEGRAGVILMSMDMQDVRTVAGLPYSMLISDSLYAGGVSHPRLYGSFPRFLREFCLEENAQSGHKLMPIETAIRKMTALPAMRAGLSDRGVITQGARADFVVFRPDGLKEGTADSLAGGMTHVFVNGVDAWPFDATAASGMLL